MSLPCIVSDKKVPWPWATLTQLWCSEQRRDCCDSNLVGETTSNGLTYKIVRISYTGRDSD